MLFQHFDCKVIYFCIYMKYLMFMFCVMFCSLGYP